MNQFKNKENGAVSADLHYLKQLTFNEDLRKGVFGFFVKNHRVIFLLIFLIVGAGIFSYTKLPLESNPEVKIPFAVVTTVYPGASPSDIEELITKKIETEISQVKGVKKITSSSSNSFSAISVEFDTSADQDTAIRQLRDSVKNVEQKLPDDADEPIVSEASFDDAPILTISMTGPFDGFQLKSYAEKIKNELEKISGVREVQLAGGDDREFRIAYIPEKLSALHVSIQQANQAISQANIAVPAGNFEGTEFNYPIRSDARLYYAGQIKNIPITHGEQGATILLGDIADVQETAVKKTRYSRVSIQGSLPEESITLSIIKKTGGSVIDTVTEAKKTVDTMTRSFSPEIRYSVSIDNAERIHKDFNRLTHDLLLTLVLVMGTLFLIIGLKEAIVAGLAIPLVFCATFIVMHITGTSLNFLSIFSLILALGLLVDDAIVVVSATKQYMRTGKFTPEEAVLLVLRDFKIVLLTTTLATTWAFLPLLLSSGIMGEFIKSIPITVSVTLVASLLIALFINHPLAAVLERVRMTKKVFFSLLSLLVLFVITLVFQKNPFSYVTAIIFAVFAVFMLYWYIKLHGSYILVQNKIQSENEWKNDDLIREKLRLQGKSKDASFLEKLTHGIVHFDTLIPIYERAIRFILETKKRAIIAVVFTGILFITALSLPIIGVLPSEFFPSSDEDIIYIGIEAPPGLNIHKTDAITKQVEQILLDHAEIVTFSTVVGARGISPNQANSFDSDSSNLANIVVSLTDEKQRLRTSYEIADAIREKTKDIQGAEINVESPRGGPPSGSAFEAKILGDDLITLDAIATDVKQILVSVPGTTGVSVSLKNAPAEYTFMLDNRKMELLDIDPVIAGSVLRTAVSGVKIGTIIRNNKEIPIMTKITDASVSDLNSIQNIQIVNRKNKSVFLKDAGEIILKPSVETITRIDQKRAVLVSSGVSGTTRPTDVLANFQKKLNDTYTFPQGYTILYGGENEQNTDSVKSILQAMILAAALIISTMVIQFNSFTKSLIVLVTLPLALIGTFFGMAIFAIPLSFPALIGILALFGIVVKNAIILIDKINMNIKSSIPFIEAIIDAGKSRLEAICITSLCTIFGILPITLSNELWRGLGSAVIFGLALSSLLTLFIIPVLFYILVKNKH